MRKITLKSASKNIGNAAAAGAGLVAGSFLMKQAENILPQSLPSISKGVVGLVGGLLISAFSPAGGMLAAAGLGVTMAGVINITQEVAGDKLPMLPTLNGGEVLAQLPAAGEDGMEDLLLNGADEFEDAGAELLSA